MKIWKIKNNKYEECQKNINYNVIQNLKNFEEIFGLNKIHIYEKIFKEGKKYISFLNNNRQSIGLTNLLKNNFQFRRSFSKYF